MLVIRALYCFILKDHYADIDEKKVVADETHGFWNDLNTSKFMTSNKACYLGERRKIFKSHRKPSNVILLPNETWKCQWRNEEGKLDCEKDLLEEPYFYHGEYKIEDGSKHEAWCFKHWEQ